jgi:hypothetical protein
METFAIEESPQGTPMEILPFSSDLRISDGMDQILRSVDGLIEANGNIRAKQND